MRSKMNNSILTLYPYKFHCQWIFDDPSTNLLREVFVCGIDKMLDYLTEQIFDRDNGIILFFSSFPFPGFKMKLDWIREEYGGNWYWCNQYHMEGWLCPALYKYFEIVPSNIYINVMKKYEK